MCVCLCLALYPSPLHAFIKSIHPPRCHMHFLLFLFLFLLWDYSPRRTVSFFFRMGALMVAGMRAIKFIPEDMRGKGIASSQFFSSLTFSIVVPGSYPKGRWCDSSKGRKSTILQCSASDLGLYGTVMWSLPCCQRMVLYPTMPAAFLQGQSA
ncbi:hypothetical protein TCDM_05463 [Trypanosoma cruzi Dm28c]|uniref:Uncharacterized protein n=1 Tax=Trypanosoma cruzi Dm28c TaxID=1416333 RepID=V5BE18_TRYCR|nr:hypothetical protein TCDM_05463 [Trypanosoma cruzi Dm28c]